jgi:hypothetical protein
MKWPEIFPLPDQSAMEVADLLVDEVCRSPSRATRHCLNEVLERIDLVFLEMLRCIDRLGRSSLSEYMHESACVFREICLVFLLNWWKKNFTAVQQEKQNAATSRVNGCPDRKCHSGKVCIPVCVRFVHILCMYTTHIFSIRSIYLSDCSDVQLLTPFASRIAKTLVSNKLSNLRLDLI